MALTVMRRLSLTGLATPVVLGGGVLAARDPLLTACVTGGSEPSPRRPPCVSPTCPRLPGRPCWGSITWGRDPESSGGCGIRTPKGPGHEPYPIRKVPAGAVIVAALSVLAACTSTRHTTPPAKQRHRGSPGAGGRPRGPGQPGADTRPGRPRSPTPCCPGRPPTSPSPSPAARAWCSTAHRAPTSAAGTPLPAVYQLGFSGLTRPGSYRITVHAAGTTATSPTFAVGPSAGLYHQLVVNAVRYFTSERDGADVVPSVLTAQPANLTDERACVYASPRYDSNDNLLGTLRRIGGPVNVSGGWFDAGGGYEKFAYTSSLHRRADAAGGPRLPGQLPDAAAGGGLRPQLAGEAVEPGRQGGVHPGRDRHRQREQHDPGRLQLLVPAAGRRPHERQAAAVTPGPPPTT